MAISDEAARDLVKVTLPTPPVIDKAWVYFDELTSSEKVDRAEVVSSYVLQFIEAKSIADADGRVMSEIGTMIPPRQALDVVLEEVSARLGLPQTDIMAAMLRAVGRHELELDQSWNVCIPQPQSDAPLTSQLAGSGVAKA